MIGDLGFSSGGRGADFEEGEDAGGQLGRGRDDGRPGGACGDEGYR
ncbi:MAG: hypothetical protein M3256_24735 [Actinomycetota bacterium]|nr:hypothetical protein [Actinomycetota bacterium]